MLRYFKSFFVNAEQGVNPYKKDIIKYHYELRVVWFNNFMKFTTKIKQETSDKEVDIYEILDKYAPQYNKLTIQERLIDFLFRTKTAMFTDSFKSGVYHIASLQLIKGIESHGGKITYDTPIAEATYDISIEVDQTHEWEIV